MNNPDEIMKSRRLPKAGTEKLDFETE